MELMLAILLCVVLVYFLIRERKQSFTEESFITIVNHTFRTPLTRIKWMSESLSGDLSRAQQLETAQNISNSVNRLMGVVDTLVGIKDIHSRASYELSAVSLRELFEQAVAKYRLEITNKKLSLSMPAFENIPLLTIDTKKISFVLDVILENAIMYSPDGGTITMSAEMRDNFITINITDAGIGLTPRDVRNLFRRFYRGDEAKKINTDGMGLGLYVSKVIIERHNGRISGRSNASGIGSTFTIALPSKK